MADAVEYAELELYLATDLISTVGQDAFVQGVHARQTRSRGAFQPPIPRAHGEAMEYANGVMEMFRIASASQRLLG